MSFSFEDNMPIMREFQLNFKLIGLNSKRREPSYLILMWLDSHVKVR